MAILTVVRIQFSTTISNKVMLVGGGPDGVSIYSGGGGGGAGGAGGTDDRWI